MRSSVQCQEGCWVIYDRQCRLKASAVPIPEWPSIDITVWKMAFPERPPIGDYYEPTKPYSHKTVQLPLTGSPLPGRICLEWNESTNPECLHPSGRFDHICYRSIHTNASNKNHKAIFCPSKQKRPQQPPNSREKNISGVLQQQPVTILTNLFRY